MLGGEAHSLVVTCVSVANHPYAGIARQHPLKAGAGLTALLELPVRERISRAKYVAENDLQVFDRYETEMIAQITALTDEGGL